jgi:hypothetical protein
MSLTSKQRDNINRNGVNKGKAQFGGNYLGNLLGKLSVIFGSGSSYSAPAVTVGHVLVGDGTNFNSVALSGDATVAADGTLTLAAGQVSFTELDTITDGSILVGKSSANFELDAKTDGYILVGDGTDLNSVAVSGDVALTNAGVSSIAKLAGTEDIDSKIYIGESGGYYQMTAAENVIGIYAEDTVNSGYSDGVSSTMKATTAGTGAGALRPFQGSATADTSSDLSELYGASFYSTQNDGSKVRDNMYGSMAWLKINETDAADDPQGYITSVMGIYDTPGIDPSVTLTNPGCKAAIAGIVKDNANSKPHAAVMAFMEGDSTGTTVPAAFKAVSVRSTAGGGFTYGLDLYDEAGWGNNIQTADIRMHSGASIASGTAVPTHSAVQGSLYIRTGQAANASIYINNDGATGWTLLNSLV